MEFVRVNTYDDKRFREKVLRQHGAFLLDGIKPCEVEIVSKDSAVVFCEDTAAYLVYFAREAQKRNVFSVKDMKLLSHLEYEVRWNQYCEEFFARQEPEDEQERKE